MKHNRISGICTGLLCLLMLFVFPLSAFAAESDQRGSIAVSYFHENRAAGEVTFHIYRVADEAFQPVGAYADYPVLLEDQSPVDWGAAAATLAAYTARDGIAATRSDATNIYGYLKFDDLPTGVYLVVGEMQIEDDTVYAPLPFLAALPCLDITDGQLLYEITAAPKYDMWKTDTPIERNVKKVWADNGYESDRPAQITVQLLENGKISDEVLLSEANDWSHSWNNLEPTSVWMIVEKEVPEDYTVSVKQQSTVFTVTNTHITVDDEPPADGGSSSSSSSSSSTPSSTLPSTGQLWWPVPILLAAGALMLLIGVFLSRKSDRTDA